MFHQMQIAPQFKQLFHLDICKCVYKRCLINIALQFIPSELCISPSLARVKWRHSVTSVNKQAAKLEVLNGVLGDRKYDGQIGRGPPTDL